MFKQTTVTQLLLLIILFKFLNGELELSTKILSNNFQFQQIDPGKVQYIVKSDDFLGLSKLNKSENDELQKICGKTDFETRDFKSAVGNRAMPGQFPWVIAFGEEHAYCSGTIISSRHVLTAAHCVSTYSSMKLPCKNAEIATDLSKLKISYGGVCFRKDENLCSNGRDMKSAKVRKFLIPKHFNENSCIKGADIAILELEEDLIFNNQTKPICVGYFNSESEGQLFDLGFGRDENNRQVSNLRFIETVIFDQHFTPILGNIFTLPKYILPKGRKQPGMCHGDSGGPFQINIGFPIISYLHGIHSFGGGCGKLKAHSNTNILFYIEWICEKTGICREWEASKSGKIVKKL